MIIFELRLKLFAIWLLQHLLKRWKQDWFTLNWLLFWICVTFFSVVDHEFVIKSPSIFLSSSCSSVIIQSNLITAHINVKVWLYSYFSYWSLPACHSTTGSLCGFSPQDNKSLSHINCAYVNKVYWSLKSEILTVWRYWLIPYLCCVCVCVQKC